MATNHIADRNYKIVDHLRQRFKDRYGIELTREIRLDLLAQIQKGKMSNLCCLLPGKAEVRRVKIKNTDFNVVYDVKLKQITTVLSSPDSPDFEKFCQEHPYWSKEKILSRYMTPKERTEQMIKKAQEQETNAINDAYDQFVEEQKQKRIKESKEIVKSWKSVRKIQIKKEIARKNHE